ASGDHSSLAYSDIRQHDGAGSKNSALLDHSAARLTEMRDDRTSNAYHRVILNLDEMRVRGLDDRVVTNPDSLSYLDPAPTMQPDAQCRGAGTITGDQLQESVERTQKSTFVPCHTGPSERRDH